MKSKWFNKQYGIYLPVHPMGFLVTALAVIFMIPVTMATVRHGHSVSDNLYQLFVYGTCTAFWWKWVAEANS